MAKTWFNVRLTQETMVRLEEARRSLERQQARDGRYPIREHGREDGAISWDTVIGVLLARDERHRKASNKKRTKKVGNASFVSPAGQTSFVPLTIDHVYMVSQGG